MAKLLVGLGFRARRFPGCTEARIDKKSLGKGPSSSLLSNLFDSSPNPGAGATITQRLDRAGNDYPCPLDTPSVNRAPRPEKEKGRPLGALSLLLSQCRTYLVEKLWLTPKEKAPMSWPISALAFNWLVSRSKLTPLPLNS